MRGVWRMFDFPFSDWDRRLQRLYHITGMTHFPFPLCLERQAPRRRRSPITTVFTHDWRDGSIPVPVSCGAFPKRQSISHHSTVDQPLPFTYPESRAYRPTWCKRGVCVLGGDWLCWGWWPLDTLFFRNNHGGSIGRINTGPTDRLHAL